MGLTMFGLSFQPRNFWRPYQVQALQYYVEFPSFCRLHKLHCRTERRKALSLDPPAAPNQNELRGEANAFRLVTCFVDIDLFWIGFLNLRSQTTSYQMQESNPATMNGGPNLTSHSS